MNKFRFKFLLVFSVVSMSSCNDGTTWDQSIHDNSASLLSHHSEKNKELIDRTVKLIVFEVSYNGIGSPEKLRSKSVRIWEFSHPEVNKLIVDLGEAVDNSGFSANGFFPRYQILAIDNTGTVIGHWRIESSPVSTSEYALIFPTGGMYKMPGFGRFSDKYLSQASRSDSE